ncbi:MAG: ThuA domain-containing protein, partial [Bacteroidota bacterium]
MKRRIWLLTIVALIIGVAAYALIRKKPDVRVLVFSKTAGYRHVSIEPGQEAFRQLAAKHDFQVEFSEDAEIFNEEDLSRFKVVVFLNTTGDILEEAQQLEFNRFIQGGGGFVGIHAACDTEYEWGWYGGLIGAYFESHPLDPNVREATIQVLNQDHSATKMLAAEWTRSDEWYNFKAISPNIQVLMNLDESSYEGGTNGENHPISWYQEYDGGRMFFTGLGHTDETFSEKLFLEHLWGGMEYVIGDGKPVDFALARVAPEENRFNKVVLDQGLYEPMELEMLPNRNILFVERRGAVKLYDQTAKQTKEVAKIEVYSGQEDGLLGLALDPKYAENNWIYLFYSPAGEEAKQHISRFKFDGENLDMESEIVMLEVPTQREECCHSAGSMEFGPNGNLFIALGDDTNPHASDGYAPIDDRPGRGPWDAQKSSANTQDLRGKILRIKPEADGSYSIPDGNLFAKDGKEGRPEIYVMGCRNPYRIAIDPATGYLYWGDVGPDAGEPTADRGPAGHDEVNQARGPGFFGWPFFIGNNKPYHDYDFEKTASLAAFDPKKPVNRSPNNTGAEILPPAQPAFIWYPYDASNEFPLVGDGGRNAMAGPVYHADAFPENPGKYPDYYDGKLFTYDWMRGWIMAVTMDENGDLKRMERFLPHTKWNNAIDMLFGPDGDLYVLEYGSKWFSPNEDARLVHLEYISGNREPVAKILADKTVGGLPLTVAFDGSESVDFDNDKLQYQWTFGESGQTSTEATPSITFDKPGRYLTTLKVDDGNGKTATAETEILVGNAPPQVSWNLEGNTQFFFPDKSVSYQLAVEDAEDGKLGQGLSESGLVATIDYLKRGFDRNEVALGHQAMVEASKATIGQQLVKNSDCQTCHQLKEKSVGPSYVEISDRYAG